MTAPSYFDPQWLTDQDNLANYDISVLDLDTETIDDIIAPLRALASRDHIALWRGWALMGMDHGWATSMAIDLRTP